MKRNCINNKAAFIFLVLFSVTGFAESLIDRYLAPRLAVDCQAYLEFDPHSATAFIFSSVVDTDLYYWATDFYAHDGLYSQCDPYESFPRDRVEYPDPISIQDACDLLQLDEHDRPMIMIFNGLVEITRDPSFQGEVCSIEGVLN
ncbi:hypothetical protein [Endozoicomonas euniceicola]|uniref:Uncharacterized protein n=1 Tax=Endozoicomonas euniceicola TaxID=1234143 RepID=A0ABY6GW85_9GAMM|nr:hypothetical protein [Endozoicomonas euniceicola]UYM17015.1 hypothetical protein NX720_03555 [Endozoicomonas euniceicola]